MLVLVSFGLVLLATILLIVGLFNDTLGLIYLSIVASVVAAIVLFLAFRLARPKAEKGRTAPEPIEPEGVDDDDATTVQPVVAADDEVEIETADDDGVGDEVDEVDEPAEVPAAAEDSDLDWMDDDEWDDEVVDFPIADYDELTVAEVMPLLPQLYSDELDLVIERERAGRNRSSIIRRLEELKVSGTEADDTPVDDGAMPVEDAPDADDAPEASPAAAAVAGTSVFAADDVDDDDDVDDEDFFPIADYDDLTVGQIMPLLSQLEPDELEDVRAREIAGAGRKTLLAEIDRRLSGDTVEATAPDAAPTPPVKATPQPAKKSTTKKSAAKKSAAKKATKKKAAGRKAASKPRFPIANYDELTVADIRPRLADLSPRQLELVREREAAGAARKTILKDIDSRLG